MMLRIWVLIVGFMVPCFAGSVWAQFVPPASDEVMLRLTQQELDEDAAGRVPKAHAESLAKQFNVPVKTVEELRASKQGWGEIAIRLSIARELTKTDPKSYPSMTEAIQRVGELRAQGTGWGEIAKQLGFTLGPVVSDVRRAREQIRAEAKKSATGGVVAPQPVGERSAGKQDTKVERGQRTERAERPARPERPERPQRPERPERAGRQ